MKKNHIVYLLISVFILSSLFSQDLFANEPELTLSVDFNDRMYRVGDVITTSVTVINSGTVEVENIRIGVYAPHQLVNESNKANVFPSLSAGEGLEISISYRAIEAGRGRIYYKITADNFNTQAFSDISIAGAGWYGGDCHTHTNLSDGTGTVQQNIESSYVKGMSFLYTLDHNDTRSHIDSERITAESRGDFIAVTGIEVDDLEGHGGCFQVPYNIPGGSYFFYSYPIYEGFFEVIPAGGAEPVRIPYRDTNLDASYAYFAEVFGDKAYELVWVPGHGRPQDFTGWDLTGKIALISRGTNEFVEKIENAMKVGAVAAVIYDARTSIFNMPLSEGLYGVSITKPDGEILTNLTDSAGGTIGAIRFNAADLPQKPSRRGTKTWQEMVDETIADGGFFMPLHPGDPTYPFLNVYEIKNHVGLEIWNGANGQSEANMLSRKYWDDLNTSGEYKYVGLSNTDAHASVNVANTFNMCYLPELTIDNINHALKTGVTYGTNGPQIRFDIDGLSMGETLKIKRNKQTARVKINAFDDLHPLTKIALYKLTITGESDNTKELLKSWDVTGKNLFRWSTDLAIKVAPGEFYRIEVQSEKAAVGTAAGFACSNPVWVEKASTATNQTGISNILLKNSRAKLMQTKAGNYYIVCDHLETLKANQLRLSAVRGARITKTFNEVDNVFEIIILSPDGTNKRTMKIFVVTDTLNDYAFF